MIKAFRVIKSCDTLRQLKVAERYTQLAIQASFSSAYQQIVETAQPYIDLKQEIDNLIKLCKANIINQ